MRLKAMLAACAIARHEAASPTSSFTAIPLPPALLIKATVAEQSLMSAATTCAPAAPKLRAYSSPMPRAAPVTTMTLPSMLIFLFRSNILREIAFRRYNPHGISEPTTRQKRIFRAQLRTERFAAPYCRGCPERRRWMRPDHHHPGRWRSDWGEVDQIEKLSGNCSVIRSVIGVS